VELYLQPPRLYGVVLSYEQNVFMAWYLVKQMKSFTFSCALHVIHIKSKGVLNGIYIWVFSKCLRCCSAFPINLDVYLLQIPPSSAEVKNAWSYTSTFGFVLMT
jgi:hypothetical protein